MNSCILLIQTLLFLVAFELCASSQTLPLDSIRYFPVQHEGRVKPLNTVARQTLLLLHGSQSMQHSGASISEDEWLVKVLMDPTQTKSFKLIRIENPELLALIGTPATTRAYFSIQELEPFFQTIFDHSSEGLKVDPSKRNAFQRSVIVLWKQIATYLSLANTIWISGVDNILDEQRFFSQFIQDPAQFSRSRLPHTDLNWFTKRYSFLSESSYFNFLPPLEGQADDKWQNMGETLLKQIGGKRAHPFAPIFANLKHAYQHGDKELWQSNIEHYNALLQKYYPSLPSQMAVEVFYNDLELFWVSMMIYLFCFLSGLLVEFPYFKRFKRFPGVLLLIGFLIHTSGLLIRIFLEGRPPVTNLYSSAIFVGWGIAGIALLLRRLCPSEIASMAGSIAGGISLIVALHLAGSGDTMEVMRAVLNSNFWLSTHVIAVTLGYSATLFAGTLASLFILKNRFMQAVSKESERSQGGQIYAIVCFSLLLTAIGTILGGIWADRSWGRFWGWDPKENGALMIILWDAFILHARLGGFATGKGIMAMAAFGNVVTSFSWFGVNMLGTGLHSYGFMEDAFVKLGGFACIQLAIIGLAFLPSLRTCLKSVSAIKN